MVFPSFFTAKPQNKQIKSLNLFTIRALLNRFGHALSAAIINIIIITNDIFYERRVNFFQIIRSKCHNCF